MSLRLCVCVVILGLLSPQCLVVGRGLSVPPPDTIFVIESARDTGARLSPQPPISFTRQNFPAQVSIAVNTSMHYQTILGFGGAFTEAAAYVFSQMNEEKQQEILSAYFGPDGNKYAVCRTHINSCDFSLSSYSFDDTPNDFSLKNFNISHNNRWMIPFIKRAVETSKTPVKIFATPWSPPAWMKGNGAMDGSSIPGLINSTQIHKSWALFFVKFLDAYKEEGIDIWGITVQNEPEFAAPWEACVYTAEQERDFVKNYLGPTLVAYGHEDLVVMTYDHNKDHLPHWVSVIMSDPDAARYVQGTAFHWYTGPQFENVALAHGIAPDKFLLASEACTCPGVSLGNWTRGEEYGYDIIGDLNNWAVGWTDWNMVLDMQGGPNHLDSYCDAPVVADPQKQEVYFQIPYYYMGQISRYATPGSIRVNTTIGGVPPGDESLSAVSFVDPLGQTVVVVMNQGDDPMNGLKLVDLENSRYAQVDVLAHSIKTLLFA